MRTILMVFISSTIIALSLSSLAKALPIDDRTVLYMSFNSDPKGDPVRDESGNGNDGNIVGKGAKWTKNGKLGGAMEFDGASKIEIPHSDSLNLTKEITLEIWFRTDAAQKGRFLIYKIHNGAGRNYEWGIYLTSDSTVVSMYAVKPNDEVKAISRSGDFKNGEWHFLAGTYNGKTIRCYIDGQLQSEDWAAEIRASDGAVVIGTWGTSFFTGALDEARICKVALTEEQLKSDFENGYSLSVDTIGKLSTTWAKIKSEE